MDVSETWKITLHAPHDRIEAALVAHEDALDWDPEIVLAGAEDSASRSGKWIMEAWLPRRPRKADKAAIAALFKGKAPEMTVEKLPETDWVTESQRGLEPIRAGRFRIRTPDHPASDEPGIVDFVIPASQAFGTGHHATTAGCLAMLDRMKRQGTVVRNCADIGTGTGVLAIAALKLWPRAVATASDIDPVSTAVAIENARANGIAVGARGGEVTFTIADGMAHPLIRARGPYDLVIANILAGPLIELAPRFSRALVPGGSVLLAGLMRTQEDAVRRACRLAGLRLAGRLVEGDWSILWLRKRPGVRTGMRRSTGTGGGFDSW